MSKGPQTSITRPGFSCVFRSVIWMTIHCYTCAPPTAWSQLPTLSCHIAVAVVTILPKSQICHTCVTSQTAKVTLPSTQLPVGVLVEWQGPFWTRELTQTSNHTQGENTSTHSLHITLYKTLTCATSKQTLSSLQAIPRPHCRLQPRYRLHPDPSSKPFLE